MRPIRPIFLAAALALSAGPALATGTTDPSVPANLPALSADPEVAQRQALGCGIVGLGAAGVALASGMVMTVGSGGAAAPASVVIGELLAYFGAGCTVGAFLATALPASPPTADILAPAPIIPPADRNRRVEAAELTP